VVDDVEWAVCRELGTDPSDILSHPRVVADARDAATHLLGRRPLGLEVDAERATDLLLVLFSAEVYQTLTAGRGWSHDECERFLLDILAQQLLPEKR
jgi:hypothetical protein